MKTKMLLMAALVGAATVSAHAGVRFGFSLGLPLPVPVIVTVPDLVLRSGGVLADVAPTILAMMGIDQPAEMTGTSLIEAD